MYATKFLIWLTLNADNRSGKIEALIGVGASIDNVLFAWLEIEPLVVSGANRSKSLWLLCADCWLLMAKELQIWNDADRRFACSPQNETPSCPSLLLFYIEYIIWKYPAKHCTTAAQNETLVVPAWQKETNQLALWDTGPIHE